MRSSTVLAEFETNLHRERKVKGIAAAKERGVNTGRKPTIASDEVRRLHQQDRFSPIPLARRLGVTRSSAYRMLAQAEGTSMPLVDTTWDRGQPPEAGEEPSTSYRYHLEPVSGVSAVNRQLRIIAPRPSASCALCVARRPALRGEPPHYPAPPRQVAGTCRERAMNGRSRLRCPDIVFRSAYRAGGRTSR